LTTGDYDQAAAASIGTTHYLSELITQANAKQLAHSPVWHALLHYKKNVIGRLRSEVDSAEFFLSAEGSTVPQSELVATLAAFFSNKAITPTKYSAQCRFPARFYWLNKQLEFDANRLSTEVCDDLQKYYQAMAPESLSVIFPSAHPNSPSSMFGHTLLRINKKDQTENTRMLAFSVNYAAQIDPEQDMLSYTVLGLTGGFMGKFMVLPYYLKLREYGQIENRDLWEYDLNISKQQLDFILRHTFELTHSYFDYYFFTENCSYHLLSLLDITDADQPMTNEFPGWTIPVDTLKLMRQRNLISGYQFFPSLARKINHRQQQLTSDEIALVLLAHENGFESVVAEMEQLESIRQVKILDLLTDYLRFRKIKDSEKKVSSKLNQAERQVLSYRSKLRIPSQVLKIDPPGVSPDQGHETARVGLAFGAANKNNYIDLEWRPAYHDALDASQGFLSNSGLEFMKLKLRYSADDNTAQLQQINILNIQSIEPRNQFFSSYSWHANIDWSKTLVDNQGAWRSIAKLNGGQGLSYRLSKKIDSVLYGFIDATLLLGDSLVDNYSVLPGLFVGYTVEPIQGWRIQLLANYDKGVIGDKLTQARLSLQQSFSINRSVNIRLQADRQKFAGLSYNNFNIQAYFYF